MRHRYESACWKGVLHGTPRAVLGEDGGAVLRHLQLFHRQGLRKVSRPLPAAIATAAVCTCVR